MTDEEELFDHEKFILARDVFADSWFCRGFVGSTVMFCYACGIPSGIYTGTLIENPSLDVIIAAGTKEPTCRCWCCEQENEEFRKAYANALNLKRFGDLAEIARLEALARKGDLIAYHEWKKLTGN